MVKITQAMRDRARANSEALFTGPPCADRHGRKGKEGVSCIERERQSPLQSRDPDSFGRVRGFSDYRPSEMCIACRAYWYAEMCALTLEGRV